MVRLLRSALIPVLRQNKIGALWDGIADGDGVSQTRRSKVHRRDPPASNGVGSQTNGRRHRTRGLAASSLHLGTNPPIAPRKSPRTVRARLRDVLFRVTFRDQVDRRLPS